jgi:multiple sugar transport system ATP-binding protein
VLREALGSELIVHIEVDAHAARTDEMRELAADTGGPSPGAQAGATIVGRFSARSTARERQEIEFAVDPAELHFFDPHTGLGIYADEPKGGDT